jgi:hypothetical protein
MRNPNGKAIPYFTLQDGQNSIVRPSKRSAYFMDVHLTDPHYVKEKENSLGLLTSNYLTHPMELEPIK